MHGARSGEGRREDEANEPKRESAGTGSHPPHTGAPVLPTDILPFPVLCLDPEGHVAASNGVLERELGLSQQGLQGRSIADVVAPETRPEVAKLFDHGVHEPTHVGIVLAGDQAGSARARRDFYVVPESGGTWLIGQPPELEAQREELERSHHRAEAQADEYASVSAELHLANEELSQRAREVATATAAKSQFLATMSHELRTPLNAVLGYGGLLRDGVYGALTPPALRAVESIVRRSKDLQLMIDDVLDLSKIESGRMELRVDQFAPSAVIDEVKETIAALAREKELSLITRDKLALPVRTDRAKYKQVLLNLLSNAVKFTPRAGEVDVAVEAGDGDTFITRVRDTGIGIAPDDLTRIFENFQQLETGTTRRFAGIGLGLAFVRRLVELMGGTITAESKPGEGTTFSIVLPTALPADTIANVVDVPAAERTSSEPIVLAIDDDPEVIALLRDSLAPAHYRVVGALNGNRGLELARILKPFAITLDIMMPEKDGWEVLREIKADPTLADIPVIIMSIVSERALGYSLGVADYLVKPVDRSVLIGVLERLRRGEGGSRALVIDEDGDARTLLADLLGSLHFESRGAATGAEAIAALRAAVPDVLFLALSLPERDVAAVLEEIAKEARYRDMRVIVVTKGDGRPGAERGAVNSDLVRRTADTVLHDGSLRPEELMRELKNALAAATKH